MPKYSYSTTSVYSAGSTWYSNKSTWLQPCDKQNSSYTDLNKGLNHFCFTMVKSQVKHFWLTYSGSVSGQSNSLWPSVWVSQILSDPMSGSVQISLTQCPVSQILLPQCPGPFISLTQCVGESSSLGPRSGLVQILSDHISKSVYTSMLTLFESRYTLKGRYNIGNVANCFYEYAYPLWIKICIKGKVQHCKNFINL